MAAITNQSQRHLHNSIPRGHMLAGLVSMVLAGVVLVLARRTDLWFLSVPAVAAVLAVELWGWRAAGKARGKLLLERVPALIIGLSTILIIALVPRFATQMGVAVLYAVWRTWWASRSQADGSVSLVNLLIVQAFIFEAAFLTAAIWRLPSGIVMILAWLGAYISVYAVLSRRGERAAGVMAATWGVIVLETSWVLQLWLYTYTTSGGYILVPQPALVLTALAYCFGSIYLAQREGTLSRARLAEYLLIGLILIAIVATGTSWRGNI